MLIYKDSWDRVLQEITLVAELLQKSKERERTRERSSERPNARW